MREPSVWVRREPVPPRKPSAARVPAARCALCARSARAAVLTSPGARRAASPFQSARGTAPLAGRSRSPSARGRRPLARPVALRATLLASRFSRRSNRAPRQPFPETHTADRWSAGAPWPVVGCSVVDSWRTGRASALGDGGRRKHCSEGGAADRAKRAASPPTREREGFPSDVVDTDSTLAATLVDSRSTRNGPLEREPSNKHDESSQC